MNPKSLLSLIDRRDVYVAVGLLTLITIIFSGLAVPPDWVYRGAIDLPYYAAQETVIRHSLRNGTLPLWNIYFNEPLLANPQAAVLYPPALVLRWLPVAVALRWLTTFHLWLAGLGMYSLMRGWQVNRLAALGAALVFALSSTVIWRPIVGHMTMLYAIPWIPWLYLFYYRLLMNRRWNDFLWSAICVVMLILAGHIQFSVIALFVPVWHFIFYTINCAIKGEWRQILSALGVSFSLGAVSLGLLAVQLLPLIEYLPLTSRSVDFTFEEASLGSVNFCSMASSHLSILALIWPVNGICGQLHESSLYSILPSWGLAYLAVRYGYGEQRWLALWLMLLLLFALILGTGDASPVYSIFYQFTPFMRVPGRFMIWWGVAMPILIGFGLDRLLATKSTAELLTWRKSLAFSILLPSLFYLCAIIIRTHLLDPAALSAQLWQTAVLPVIVISLLPLIIWLYPLIRLPKFPLSQRSLVILIWLCLDLIIGLIVVLRVNPFNNFENYFHEIKAVYASLAIDPTEVRLTLQGEFENRYAVLQGIPALQFYSANLYYTQNLTELGYMRRSLAQAAGYEALTESQEFSGARVVQRTPHGQLIEYEANPPRALVVNDFVISASDEETLQLMSQAYFDFHTQAVLLELPPDLAFHNEPLTAQVEFLEYGSDSLRLRVESSQPGILVLFDAFYPGWQASVNGQPVDILRVNYASRGISVPAGASEIEMIFYPTSLKLGFWISLGTIILLITLTVVIKRSQRVYQGYYLQTSNPDEKLS